ncbi:MAG: NTP transferase domain-containing protein [Methanospirillum sp.]|uniref:NTP transferase domain-containing protein n=1 Tax=Methanospirillum sp. TaxID=45200 RepID=UPI002371DBD5|nr:NTP transferase domain-containing protein [Methanospirillum sp.]MDD1728340.1 NTP transferase domain-containing protein [Methanospirillum sp.]
MLALIMAGGRGSRLQMGEKGLVRLCDRPLIEYVLDTLENSGLEPVVITTPRTPYTANYCRVREIDQICTEGIGYVEDLVEAVEILGEKGPVLIVCADIPGLRPEHLDYILSRYVASGNSACSVWIPSSLVPVQGCMQSYTREISGVEAVPAGLNILLGSAITREQDELCILIDDPLLSFNINNQAELIAAEKFFSRS